MQLLQRKKRKFLNMQISLIPEVMRESLNSKKEIIRDEGLGDYDEDIGQLLH